MHDLMRDLCLSKAKQENLVFIVDRPNASSLSMIRKEAIEKSLPLKVLNYVEEHEDDDCNPLFWILITLARSTGRHKIHEICRYMFNNFKLLRVLNYEIRTRRTRDLFGGWKLPSDIGNLVHLRFLSLRNFEFQRSKLPSSLGNLRCLQTLDLRVDDRIHVPNVKWRMEQLRHLYLPLRCKSRTKLKLGTLTKLLTLVNFKTKNCYLKDLINMTNLRELGINLPFNIENFNEKELGENPPIIGSKYLHSLSITYEEGLKIFTLFSIDVIMKSWSKIDPRHLAHLLSNCTSICKLSITRVISELPEYHYFSSHLAYIRLICCKFEEDPMPTLEKLPNLRILELKYTSEGKEMFCSAQGFPKLESLILAELYKLEEWKVDEGAMPSLQRLEIEECGNLKMLPEGLRFITTLKELKLELMPKAFKDRLEEGGEDFCKVKHVPSVIFQKCG
ncbi:probable disease resistance RPP8-like protein 4 [Gossypium raimondii]|uniref:probable disease resistance RPP8-like protein 4 n=1 Tax=Gossypium raimondii TaxID=29730 RepID=UPI00227C8BBD|nr:probable disease resistance RPP8-like protein 4 [Gossypium raimondii]